MSKNLRLWQTFCRSDLSTRQRCVRASAENSFFFCWYALLVARSYRSTTGFAIRQQYMGLWDGCVYGWDARNTLEMWWRTRRHTMYTQPRRHGSVWKSERREKRVTNKTDIWLRACSEFDIVLCAFNVNLLWLEKIFPMICGRWIGMGVVVCIVSFEKRNLLPATRLSIYF